MAQIETLPRPSFATTVAANVRAEAARRGFNQVTLSPVLGISQPNVGRRLRGVHPFSLDELEMLADAFGIDVEVLTSRKGWAPRGSNPEPAD